LYADALALEIEDAVDVFARDQLEAADMLPADDRDWLTGIDRDEECGGVIGGEVNLAVGERERSRHTGFRCHEADVGKALRPQKLVGDILRCDADAGNLRQPNGCRFGRAFFGPRSSGAHEACDTGR